MGLLIGQTAAGQHTAAKPRRRCLRMRGRRKAGMLGAKEIAKYTHAKWRSKATAVRVLCYLTAFFGMALVS